MSAKFLLEEKENGHMSVEVTGKPHVVAAMIATAMQDDEDLSRVIKMAVIGAIIAEERDKGNSEEALVGQLEKLYKADKDKSNLN